MRAFFCFQILKHSVHSEYTARSVRAEIAVLRLCSLWFNLFFTLFPTSFSEEKPKPSIQCGVYGNL